MIATDFEHTFIVKPDDIDHQGHVSNVRYVQWIQDVAVAHWNHAASPEQLANLKWVVLRHEIDYLRPALHGYEITARTWVGALSGPRCERYTEIKHGADMLLKARSVWCALDAKTSRPRRVAEQLRERFG